MCHPRGIIVLLLLAGASMAHAQTPAAVAAERLFVERARAFMGEMRAESRVDARHIERNYGSSLRTHGLPDRAALEVALTRGMLRQLPLDATRFNLAPRLNGHHPIGEKDLAHQHLYVAAQPATLGALLHVAARARARSLDVTSLVRHHAYQQALRRTNVNAQLEGSLHTAGLAFDISILHMPLSASAELRDVLREMRDSGMIFFVAETRQLVFHVVPAPAWLEFYAATFDGLTEIEPPLVAAQVLSPIPPPPMPVLSGRDITTSVAFSPFVLMALGASGLSLLWRYTRRRVPPSP